jgi:hypothetical protein
MHVRQVTMTPELAAKLLAKNPRNRILTPYRVTALADAMTENRFIPEAAGPVVIGEDGTLHDGQHRLAATVESGASWSCILIEGAPESARLHYDTGKRRSFGDFLRMQEIPNASAIASLTRLLWIYEHGLLDTRAAWQAARSKSSPDHAQLWEFCEKNSERLLAAIQVSRPVKDNQPRLIMGSVAACAAAVLLGIDDEDCRVFFAHLGMAGNGAMPSQIVLLIRALTNLSGGDSGRYGDQQHQLALVLKSWNHWREGTEMSVLSWKLGGRNPERFPVPR